MTRARATSSSATPSKSSARLQALAAPGAVALLLGLLEARRRYFFLQDDNRGDFLPLFVHDWRALREGTLALFNFHQFLGIPHLAAGQTAVLYPPVYAALGLSRLLFGHFFAAVDILVIFHLAVGAAGMRALLRDLDLGPDASFFGAVAWALSPFAVLVGGFWLTVTPAVALLPWMALFSRRLLERGRPRDLAALVAARTLLFFSGYPEYFLYCVLFETAFAASCARPRPGRPAGLLRWLAGVPLTALAAAPLLLPMLLEVRNSAGRSAALPYWAFAHDDASPASWIMGQLWPFIPGRGAAFFARAFPPASHLGWCAAALAFLGAARSVRERRKSWAPGAAVLAAVALFWAFGWLDPAFYHLPLLGRFRFHFKLLLFADFFLILLAARELSRVGEKLGRPLVLAATALQLAGLFALAAFTPPLGLVVDTAPPPLDEPLRQALTGGRIASLGRLDLAPSRRAPLLGFNYASLWGLDQFAGYDPLVPAGNSLATFGVNESALLDGETRDPDFASRLRLWGVRWYVVDAAGSARYEAALSALGARLRFRDGARLVYEDPLAQPPAIWRETGSAAGLSTTFKTNEASVETDNAADATVVLDVYCSRGFTPSIDGVRAPLVCTPDRQLSVRVPAGRHTVTFLYEEPAFTLGLALAAASALAFALWANRTARRS